MSQRSKKEYLESTVVHYFKAARQFALCPMPSAPRGIMPLITGTAGAGSPGRRSLCDSSVEFCYNATTVKE